MIEKLKERWDVKSNAQVFMILVVFAITGNNHCIDQMAGF